MVIRQVRGEGVVMARGSYDGPERRSGNGNGNDRVTIWARAIAVVGIPGAIAIFLVWIGANEIPKITARTEATYQQTLANRDLLRELNAKQDEQLRLMRWICAGVQQIQDDRRQCFEK